MGTVTDYKRNPNNIDKAVQMLRWTYSLVPIIAGIDKFTNLLTDWDKYLAPLVIDILPFEAQVFMYVVGVIEIIAGIMVMVKPNAGSIIVGLWLLGIVINLLLSGEYFDIAIRDFTMAIGAFSLYLLNNNHPFTTTKN